jgi:ABC-type dipeptide/oligopeptide/nickel transport system permease subunit
MPDALEPGPGRTGHRVSIGTRATLWRKFWRRCTRNIATLLALAFVMVLTVTVVIGPWVAPHDPVDQDLARAFIPPGSAHWMGTDRFGADVFSRVIYGARLSLSVGFFSVVLGLTAGVGVGVTAGYVGGLADDVLMRAIDVLLAFLVVTILGSSLVNVIVALAIFSVPVFARLARGSTLAIRHAEYVDAARALGVRPAGIVWRHVLPNIWGPIIVYGTLRMAAAILGAATLSFLGLGLAPPAPEWGLMINQGRNYIQSAPHVVLYPGLAIFLTVLAFNLLGDAIRDVADPRSETV